MKISIIIPIYNVEKYIERCAISLFNQDYEDIEYIFVNDCSPDKSIEILDEVIQRYPNKETQVKIIHHTEKGGLVAAKKTAFDNSIGNYILYVDAKDWLEVDMISSLIRKADESNADIVACDYFLNRQGFQKYKKELYHEDLKQNFERLLLGAKISPYLWGKLVRRQLYSEEMFFIKRDNFANDWYINIRLFSEAKVISSVSKGLYHHWSKSPKHEFSRDISTLSLKEGIDAILDFIEKKDTHYLNLFKVGCFRFLFDTLSVEGLDVGRVVKKIFPKEKYYDIINSIPDWGYLKKITSYLYFWKLGIIAQPLFNSLEQIQSFTVRLKGLFRREREREREITFNLTAH